MKNENGPIERILKSLGELPQQLRDKFRSLGRANVEAYFDVGEMLLQQRREIEMAQEFCRTRQRDFWEELGKQVGVGKRTLYDCYRFAQEITRDQLHRLLECGATWTKIRTLFSAPPELMDGYIDLLVRGDADEQQLRQQIKMDKTEKAATRTPRSPRPPRTLNDALDRLIKEGGTFLTHAETIIFGEKYHLAQKMLDVAPDSVTEELLARSVTAAELLDTIVAEIAADAAGTWEGIERFKEVLRLRQELEQQSAGAESVIS